MARGPTEPANNAGAIAAGERPTKKNTKIKTPSSVGSEPATPLNEVLMRMKYDHELSLRHMESHEKHMKYIYGVRLAGLGISALTILIGAIMIFMGLQGAFNWAISAPNDLGSKLTNASPGIMFAVAGLFIAMITIIQSPVGYSIGNSAQGTGEKETFIRPNKSLLSRGRGGWLSKIEPGIRSLRHPSREHDFED